MSTAPTYPAFPVLLERINKATRLPHAEMQYALLQLSAELGPGFTPDVLLSLRVKHIMQQRMHAEIDAYEREVAMAA